MHVDSQLKQMSFCVMSVLGRTDFLKKCATRWDLKSLMDPQGREKLSSAGCLASWPKSGSMVRFQITSFKKVFALHTMTGLIILHQPLQTQIAIEPRCSY